MSSFGVIECFYGFPWSDEDRNSYASFLTEIGFKFYLYGPKGDDALRKNWHRKLGPEEFLRYREMRSQFKSAGLQFGMLLSPQGIHHQPDLAMRTKLQDKVKALTELRLDFLGIFFDDMKHHPHLAERQLEIVSLVRDVTDAKIIFCPSYYSHDPLLDVLFGERPPGYLEAIGNQLPAGVEVLWTGEQIISPEISAAHLKSVAAVFKRKPFICDNFYADDGPMNCNFIRVLPPSGRNLDSFSEATHWAINPMNQAHLSKLVLKMFSQSHLQGVDAAAAFHLVVNEQCSRTTAQILSENYQRFAEHGLSHLAEHEKAALKKQLGGSISPIERDLIFWLEGRYEVGLDAVLDQSCYEG